MMKGVIAGILGALLALPTVAMGAGTEENNLYWGALFTYVRYSDERIDETGEFIGGTAKLGYELGDRFAVEARIGTTGSHEFYDGTKVRLEYYTAAFGRVNITTGDAKLYALLGGTYGKFSGGENSSVDFDDSQSGLSYGVGLDLYGSEQLAVTVEYIRHIDESDYYIDAGSLGFTYAF